MEKGKRNNRILERSVSFVMERYEITVDEDDVPMSQEGSVVFRSVM